jgi:hypothetical protein
MGYIRRNTKIAVPQIFDWDNSLDNAIKVPYIIMSAVSGQPAYELWHGKSRSNLEYPSPQLHQLRKEFLKSLANTMAEFRYLQFDKTGSLHFDENPDKVDAKPPIVEYYFDFDGNSKIKKYEAYS